MTRKQKRGVLIGGGVATLAVALILVLFALKDSVVFFHTPSDIVEKGVAAGQRIRLGGLVETGSVVREGTTIRFKVTDTLKEIPVTFTGVLPDLFREGQGVVAEGTLGADGQFTAPIFRRPLVAESACRAYVSREQSRHKWTWRCPTLLR